MTFYTTSTTRFYLKCFLSTVFFALSFTAEAQSASKVVPASTTSKPVPAPKVTGGAQNKVEVAPAPTPETGKAVDFSAKDLWDKELFERDDNKVLVIQDRKYNKGGRLELGADLGMTSATAFYNSYSFGGRAAYYFNEYWGIQGFGNYSINTETNEKEQLENFLASSSFSSSKEFFQPKFFGGFGVIWNPIYGKFAWFRSRIIHFDIYGGLGVSALTMDSTFNRTQAGTRRKGDSQTALGSLANLGIRIFISKNLAWTTEVRNNVYQAKYAETTTGGGGQVIGAKKVIQNNFQFVTGVSYLFNIGGY